MSPNFKDMISNFLIGVMGPWQIAIVLLIIIAILMPLIALIDILKHEFTGSNKIIWLIVVFLLPYLGAILYFTIGTQQKIKKYN